MALKEAVFYLYEQVPISDTTWSLHCGPDRRIYGAACIENRGGAAVVVTRYNAEKDELILTEEALLVQGTDRLSSERIIYDRARERMRAGGTGRVNITITPEPEEKKGGQGPAPAPDQARTEGQSQGAPRNAGQDRTSP